MIKYLRERVARLFRIWFRPAKKKYLAEYPFCGHLWGRDVIWEERRREGIPRNRERMRLWKPCYETPWGFEPVVPPLCEQVFRFGKHTVQFRGGVGLFIDGKPGTWGRERLKQWQKQSDIIVGSKIAE